MVDRPRLSGKYLGDATMALYVRSKIWVDVACHANDGCVVSCQVPIEDWLMVCDPVPEQAQRVHIDVQVGSAADVMRECAVEKRLPVGRFELEWAA